ncbi:MAG: site-2 protease family protein [Clostridia bacterium]|nr:site-2 protease family protein [Clostridia bacterium]
MVNTLLSVASVFRTIGSILLAILILLVMITIHEFGHWIAGKILRFGINEFSIGFGPALFKHKSKKSGQIFAIRLIPLGGYCAFQGEDGLDDEKKEEEKKENAESVPSESAEEKPKESVAEAASDDTVILTPAPEETPKEEAKEEVKEETKEEDFFADLPAPTAEEGKKKKRTPAWKEKPDDGSFTRKAPWKRIIVLVAGALMNYILALFLIIICFFAYGQTMTAAYKVEPSDEIPAEYCLQDKDIFLKANGKNLYLTVDLARALNGKKAGDKVELYISRLFIDETATNPETGEEEVVKSHREKMTVEIILRSDVSVKNSSELDSAWAGLGIVNDEENGGYQLASGTAKFGFFETLGRAIVYSFKIAGSILRVIGELLTGRLGISAMGGPISTIKATSEMASLGFRYFLEISAFIGVNLAVFNLLPVPALDGSKVVFTIIEWIRGKPISRKVEAIIHAVGFVLLLGFAVLVDILQFV